MKFLVDEDLPRSTVTLLQGLGYDAVDVRDIGLRGFPDDQIAAYAKANRLCLVTADRGFANIRQFPPREYHGLVVLDLPSRSNLPIILRLLREFFVQSDLIPNLNGKLAIVAFGRVRLREV